MARKQLPCAQSGQFVLATLAHCALVVLIGASLFEACGTIVGFLAVAQKAGRVAAFGGLAVALLPTGALLFWSVRAISAQVGSAIAALRCNRGLTFDAPPPLRREIAVLPRRAEHGWGDAGTGMVAAFLTALSMAIAALAVFGTAERGTSIALQLTGRLSLLLFLGAYGGAAAAVLFGQRFAIVARHGRDFGLAYAAAQLVHLALVARIIALSGALTVDSIMPFSAIGVVWTYLLASSSVEPVSSLFFQNFWRIVRNVGLEYLALVFFVDLVLQPLAQPVKHVLLYLPFSIAIIAAASLRLAAALQRAGLLGAESGLLRAAPRLGTE